MSCDATRFVCAYTFRNSAIRRNGLQRFTTHVPAYIVNQPLVRMRQPLPRIVVIVYFCKLFGHSPVYSCILIRVTFIQFLLWLTVKLRIIDYALSCVDREVVIPRPRQEEALMHLHDGICCTLSISTVHVRVQN